MAERQRAIARRGVERLSVERLFARGEGIATQEGRRVYVPYALAGETVATNIKTVDMFLVVS